MFFFVLDSAEKALHNPEDRTTRTSHFHEKGAQTCYMEGSGSLPLWSSPLSGNSRTGKTWLSFPSRFLLISPPPPPIPTAHPRGIKTTFGSSNCKIHVNINTEKKASKTGAREMFLPQLSLAAQPWRKNAIREVIQEVTMSHRNPKWVEFGIKATHPIHTHSLGMMWIFISCFWNTALV